MKYLKFDVDVTELERGLAEQHELPAGQWFKADLDARKKVLTLTFGSEAIQHPYTFPMTLADWKHIEAQRAAEAAAKAAAEQAAAQPEEVPAAIKARRAKGKRAKDEQAEANTGDVAGA